MRTRPIPRWPWLLSVAAALLLCHSAGAEAQTVCEDSRGAEVRTNAASPHAQPHIAAEVRERLAEAAGDRALASWQRDYMLDLARGDAGGAVASQLRTVPGAPQGPAGVTADDGSWIALPPPAARYGHTAIYDPLRNRMLVFGGYGFGGGGSVDREVWALSLGGKSPVWTMLAASGTPPSGALRTAIYDPVRDRMVVFGGYDTDVWALALSGGPAWSELVPTGSLPTPRGHHTAIYDPVRDRMVVFGGFSLGGGPFLNDVWALSLSGPPAWTVLTPSGSLPAERLGHTAIYDPLRDRMLVFGGRNGSTRYNDVWALSLSESPAWSELVPTGSPPAPRGGHTAIYDSVRDRMVVFGGFDGSLQYADVWLLSLSGNPAWSELAPAGSLPPGRNVHTAIYDSVGDRMLVFGGVSNAGLLNDGWALSLGGSPAWSEAGTSRAPSARYAHTAIYDPVRDRMLVFGGVTADPFGPIFLNDVWALSLTGDPVWSRLAPTGVPPAARFAHSSIYDPPRDRMLVFGGTDYTFDYNDVWALSLAGTPAWSQLAPQGTAPAWRYEHAAIYDPVRDRMLVFGGIHGAFFNDVWALSLAEPLGWSLIAPGGAPPPGREGPTAIYDSASDRMLVFGGWVFGPPGYLNDTWALSLAGSPSWSEVAPASPPPAREWHSAIYDPVRNRMVVFGGHGANTPILDDVWALSLAEVPAWSLIAPTGFSPDPRFDHTAVYDPVRNRMLVFGGYTNYIYYNDVCALEWGSTTSVPGNDATPVGFALSALRPNPSRGPVTMDFTLLRAADVSLMVYDVAGRLVRVLTDGPLPAGPHSTLWNGRDQGGRAVAPGVYLVRLAAPGASVVCKAVILETSSR